QLIVFDGGVVLVMCEIGLRLLIIVLTARGLFDGATGDGQKTEGHKYREHSAHELRVQVKQGQPSMQIRSRRKVTGIGGLPVHKKGLCQATFFKAAGSQGW